LQATAEFEHLSRDIPDQGNSFSFVSERFSRALLDLQSQAMNAAAAKNQSAAQSQWLQSLLGGHRPGCTYSVGAHTADGFLIVANGTQNGASFALIPAVAASGALAAIAIPNFVKARAVSQENACINNLRQIDAAKNEWALEKRKNLHAVPAKEDLLPYLGKWPVCPVSGHYTIGPVGELPTCSVPGHRLP
jgi:hypothetical protein